MIPALTPSAVSPRTTSPVHSDSEIDPLDELCKMPGDEGVDGVRSVPPPQGIFMPSTDMDGLVGENFGLTPEQSLMMMVQLYRHDPDMLRGIFSTISSMTGEKPDDMAVTLPLEEGIEIKIRVMRLDNDEKARLQRLMFSMQSLNMEEDKEVLDRMDEEMRVLLDELVTKGKAEYVDQQSSAGINDEKMCKRMEKLREMGAEEENCTAWASHKDYDVEMAVAFFAFLSGHEEFIPLIVKAFAGKTSSQGQTDFNGIDFKKICSDEQYTEINMFVLRHLAFNLRQKG